MSLQTAIAAIEQQQPKQRTDVWMVGEQLKDMLRANPQWADMVERDLKNKEQSLEAVAKKIRELAKKNKTGNFGCVTPAEAEKIIRETYGIPEEGAGPAPAADSVINLEEFF